MWQGDNDDERRSGGHWGKVAGTLAVSRVDPQLGDPRFEGPVQELYSGRGLVVGQSPPDDGHIYRRLQHHDGPL